MSNNKQIEQDLIIEAIIQRIKDEEKKHSKSIEDWYRIAANKIYATFDIKIKENMSNNKARKYISPILEELMTEITPEEMKATEQKMLQELNKQTAVDWLEEQMPIVFKNLTINKHLFEQAKEMEKQEIMNAYYDSTSQFSVDARMDYPKSAEQYYNETFGGKDEQ